MFGCNNRADKRVARGAALLDQDRPGWEGKVDLDRLDLLSTEDCVLGQVYDEDGKERGWMDGFHVGVERLDLGHVSTDGMTVSVGGMGFIKCMRHGFAQSTPFEGRTVAAWGRLITARLRAQAEAEVVAAAEAQVAAEARCLAAAEQIKAYDKTYEREMVSV